MVLQIGGGIFYFQNSAKVEAEKATELKLFGNVDVREVNLDFRQSDRISEIFVEEGDAVTEEQILARLDNRQLLLQIAKAKSQIQTQEAALLKLKNGTRPEDIAQYAAESSAASAEQHYLKLKNVYEETEGGAISRDELETALLTYAAQNSQVEEARQAYNLAVAVTRYEKIQESEGQLKYLQDELAYQEFLLTQYELISLNNKKWECTYIDETDFGKIFEGQTAQIFIDSFPSENLTRQTGYISSTSEFTPKTVQTEELRISPVYEIRIYVNDSKKYPANGNDSNCQD